MMFLIFCIFNFDLVEVWKIFIDCEDVLFRSFDKVVIVRLILLVVFVL